MKQKQRGPRYWYFRNCVLPVILWGSVLQQLLLREAKKELLAIAKYTQRKDYLAFVGLPLEYNGKLYNVAAAVTQGKVLGLVPKTHIPNYNEFYERRHFAPGMKQPVPVALDEDTVVPMGTRVLFQCRQMPELKIGAEICEDVWAPNPPGVEHALAGATLLVNLSASDEDNRKRYVPQEPGDRAVRPSDLWICIL